MAGAAMKKREGPKAPPTPDYQEIEALRRAVAAGQKFSPGLNEATATVVISEWILARTALAARPRITANLLFDLGDARLRGFVEAALPNIAETLAGLPADKPLFELSADEVIQVFMAGIEGAREAAVAANEDLGFPFSDEVSF